MAQAIPIVPQEAPRIVVDCGWGGESWHYEMDYKTALERGLIVEVSETQMRESQSILLKTFSLQYPKISVEEVYGGHYNDEPLTAIPYTEISLGVDPELALEIVRQGDLRLANTVLTPEVLLEMGSVHLVVAKTCLALENVQPAGTSLQT
jgi:hypothetical protein